MGWRAAGPGAEGFFQAGGAGKGVGAGRGAEAGIRPGPLPPAPKAPDRLEGRSTPADSPPPSDYHARPGPCEVHKLVPQGSHAHLGVQATFSRILKGFWAHAKSGLVPRKQLTNYPKLLMTLKSL